MLEPVPNSPNTLMSAACCRAHWLLAWQHKAEVCLLLLHRAGQLSVEVDGCSAK